MRTLKLRIEYDGSNFVGWQIQDNGRSVQGVLEQALSQLLQESIRVVGAGRTDAGVHARGQVAHCGTLNLMDLQRIVRGGNALLPTDVVIYAAEDVPDTFHARYSAIARRYRYSISKTPTALNRNRCWFVGHALDLSLMQDCADMILGDHDFFGFSKAAANVKHHHCRISRAGWTKEEDMMLFDVTSNRFLHGMVRALVGTMVDVGRGHMTKDDFAGILTSKDRNQTGMSAPPQGLVLEEVVYPATRAEGEAHSDISESDEE